MTKGYIPVDIPTKKYIKAYVRAQLGERPIMALDNHIGNKLQSLLKGKPTNEEKNRFASSRYNDVMRVYISRRTLRRKGCNLNETNIKEFNSYIECLVKYQFYFMMDFYSEVLPSFEGNLPQVRRMLKIDVEEWPDDSMKQDYYRYRKRTGKDPFYNKKIAATVPSADFASLPFL